MGGKQHRKIMQAEMIMAGIVSYSCCTKLPQTEWLKIIDIYSPTVMETRSLKARYHQGYVPSKDFGEESFLASSQLLLVGNSWCALIDSYITTISALSSHTAVFLLCVVSVQIPFSLQGYQSLYFRP